MIVLDASVVIGLLDGDDPHHEAAAKVLAAVGATDLGISPITLAEVLVGPTRAGHADRVRAVLDALDVRTIDWGSEGAAQLATLRVATGLKLPDCCVLLAAQHARAKSIATFDLRLGRVAAERYGLSVLGAG